MKWLNMLHQLLSCRLPSLHSKVNSTFVKYLSTEVTPKPFLKMDFDRASEYRANRDWIENAQSDERTSYVVFSGKRVSPFVQAIDGNSGYKLKRFKPSEISTKMSLVVFLGIEKMNSDKQPLFAMDLSRDANKDFQARFADDGFFLPGFPGILQLSDYESLLCSQACSILTWHRLNPFCPACGSPTELTNAGYKRRCSNTYCVTHQGTILSFFFNCKMAVFFNESVFVVRLFISHNQGSRQNFVDECL